MFYKRKNNRNKASLWLSAINPPFNMDESDIIPLNPEMFDYSLINELADELIDDDIDSKAKEI